MNKFDGIDLCVEVNVHIAKLKHYKLYHYSTNVKIHQTKAKRTIDIVLSDDEEKTVPSSKKSATIRDVARKLTASFYEEDDSDTAKKLFKLDPAPLAVIHDSYTAAKWSLQEKFLQDSYKCNQLKLITKYNFFLVKSFYWLLLLIDLYFFIRYF